MDISNNNSQLPDSRFLPDSAEPARCEIGDLALLDQSGKKAVWNQILNQIKILSPVKIYPYIKEGQFISIDNNELVIGFPRIYNFHRSRLEDIALKGEVELIVEKVSGAKVSVIFVTIGENGLEDIIKEPPTGFIPVPPAPSVGTAEPGNIKSPGYPAGDDKWRLKEKILQDERVKKILEVFEAKIADVKKV